MTSNPAIAPARRQVMGPAILPGDIALERDQGRRIAFVAVMVLLFIKMSTINELIHTVIGRSLYLLYIFTPPALLGMALAGGIQRTLRNRMALIWTAFGLWLCLIVPFSFWPGASARLVFSYFRDDLSMMFLLAGTIASWKDLRNVLRCIVLAVSVPVLFSLLKGNASRSDQLIDNGTLSNANDFAAHLLLTLPLLIFFATRPQTPKLFRLAAVLMAGLQTFAILRTASRGALIALCVAAVVYFVTTTGRQRIIAILLVPAALAGSLFLLPKESFARLFSFAGLQNSEAVAEALESQASREYLLRRSIEFSLRFPVFGVGPGQFSIFEGTESRDVGARGAWHVTHNAYTQVSSESGFPGLILFLTGIGVTGVTIWRVGRRARATGHRDLMTAASCVLSGYIGFCVAIIFLSLAYAVYMPMMAGIAMGFSYVAHRELNRRSAVARF